MHYLYGFLAATFVIHAVAFTILAVKRRKSYYFCLTGTFVFLTALYLLKFYEISWRLAVAGTGMSLQVALRISAIACTLTYLWVIARTPGTWLSRLLRRG